MAVSMGAIASKPRLEIHQSPGTLDIAVYK